jgi:hypothetical protein
MAIEDMPFVTRMAVERGDAAPLEAALRMLEEIGRVTPESPLVPYHRARVLEAMSKVTGETSWLGEAARAHLEAVERGYDSGDNVRQAIASAAAASDADVLRALEALLGRGGRKIDPEIARAIEEASRR